MRVGVHVADESDRSLFEIESKRRWATTTLQAS